MQFSIYQALAIICFVVCIGSFAWGMRRFFVQPAGATTGMKVVAVAGAVLLLAHLYALGSASGMASDHCWTACLMYAAALALFWWAIATNRDRPLSAAFSPDLPAHLVERGPYRFVRHPFYTSYLLTWCAGVVATGQLWLLTTVVAMLVIYVRAAVVEEGKFSRSPLAAAYNGYRNRTGLFVPNPLKLLTARRS